MIANTRRHDSGKRPQGMMALSAKSSPARRSIRDGPRREKAHDRGFHRSCDVVPVAARPSFVTS